MLIIVQDRADGTGINVTVSGSDSAALNMVQIQDTALTTWRDTVSRIGDGQITVAAGKGVADITTDRAYLVRVNSTNPAGFSNVVAIQPTNGYACPAFTLLMQAKRVLLQENYARIGGKVFHCIDPNGMAQVIGTVPALIVFQQDKEVNTARDNLTDETSYPLEVGILETVDYDIIGGLEWWLWIRYQIFQRFDRKPIDLDGPTYGGRKWSASYGPIGLQAPGIKYEARYQSIILNGLHETSNASPT